MFSRLQTSSISFLCDRCNPNRLDKWASKGNFEWQRNICQIEETTKWQTENPDLFRTNWLEKCKTSICVCTSSREWVTENKNIQRNVMNKKSVSELWNSLLQLCNALLMCIIVVKEKTRRKCEEMDRKYLRIIVLYRRVELVRYYYVESYLVFPEAII